MDVSIAVSLIRGQMGTVVERAVNGAVETVLAEMLKVVGVKFEELKAQVSSQKKELTALQREKSLKDKENDKIRAMLRYAELKLKYYRQGVEEEMQQRGPAPGLQRTASGLEGAPPLRISHGSRSRPPPVRLSSSSSSLVALETPGSAPPQCVDMDTPPTHTLKEGGVAGKEEGEESDDCVWAGLSLQPQADAQVVLDVTCDLLPAPGSGPAPSSSYASSSDPPPSPDPRPTQADSSTLTLQVKQEEEFHQEEEESEEVICIKEEPEEQQEVMATLLPDFDLQPGSLPGSEEARSLTGWTAAPPTGQQRSHMGQRVTFSSTAHSSYSMAHQADAAGGPLTGGSRWGGGPVAAGPGPPRPPSRPWSKDLSLYEEYKLRRNELRRRSINRRREMEKALPQPLLADLVRERREKTRLRVARWRAKRKLQACLLTQAQGGGAAGGQNFTQHHHHHQLQQLRATGAAPSSGQQRRSSPVLPQCPGGFLNSMTSSNTFPASLSFSSTSSSFSPASSSLLSAPPHGGPPEQHVNQHAVTSSSSSSNPASNAQLSLSQPGISLTDADFFPGL